MNPIAASELKAFIFALSLLDEPLPDAVQREINTVNLPTDIVKLSAIAQTHPPLAASYHQVQEFLDKNTEVRSKGVDVIADPPSDSSNEEVENTLRTINRELIELDKENCQPILKAANPVQAAKDFIQGLLTKTKNHI